MDNKSLKVELFNHFDGSAEVIRPRGLEVTERAIPEGPTLDPPEALFAEKPGVLIEPDASGDVLVLASHGRKADLRSKITLIEAAHAVGKRVELHVYDDLGKEH